MPPRGHGRGGRAPPPQKEIAQLMRFIAEAAKHVTCPMSVVELCKQFKSESGSWLSIGCLEDRIRMHRLRIHEMNEFDMDTKVRMMFALSAPIDAGFLIEMKKVADVEVDDRQRIIHYKQKDGGVELSAKYLPLSMNQGEKRSKEIMQFLAKTSETTDSPIHDRVFSRNFKETTGCSDSVESIEYRYRRVRETIYQSTGFDKNTKIKMMFISNVKLSEEILKKLRREAVVEVDKKGKIMKYNSKDGSLKLGGSRGSSYPHFDSWLKICEKGNKNESEGDKKEDSNHQRDYEKKRIHLVKFLFERTQNATCPLNIQQLARDYKTEFKSSDVLKNTVARIRHFRQRIHKINQFEISTKVKMMFALSATVDAEVLKEMQKDSTVELDEKRRIRKYEANDGSLELERDCNRSAKIKSAWANKKKKKKKSRVINASRDSEDSESVTSQSLAVIPTGRKRAREVSERDDELSLKVEDDWSMDFDAYNADVFDYDPSKYELDMEHIPIEKKPESLIEVKTEEPEVQSSSNRGDYTDYGLSSYYHDFNPPCCYQDTMNNHEKDMNHIPVEQKPEGLIDVKLAVPEEPSTSNLVYHYEENSEHILIDPKPEIV